MTMGASKGLTVRATIVAGAEEGIMPRAEAELSEERRLLYVAMTRPRHHLFVTWSNWLSRNILDLISRGSHLVVTRMFS